MTNIQPPKNIDCLDAFRGVAILVVFVFHYATEGLGLRQQVGSWNGDWRSFHISANQPVNAAAYLVSLGWAGVSLFFVLSGFVIHFAFETATGHTWYGFFRRRFWRIYPPYLLALLVFSVSGGLVYNQLIEFNWRQFLLHAALVHTFFDWSFQAVNPAFWSLAVECQFYLAYPLVRFGFAHLGPGRRLLAAALLSVAARSVAWAVRGSPGFDPWWHNPFAMWVDWVLGAYFAKSFLDGRRVFPRPLPVIILSGVLFLASTLYRPTAGWWFSLASLFAATVLDARLHATPPAIWLWVERRLAFVGLVSYSLYLYHLPLIDYLFRWWQMFAPPSAQPRGALELVALPVVFVLLLLVSWLLYRGVEVPCIRIGRGIRAPKPLTAKVPAEPATCESKVAE